MKTLVLAAALAVTAAPSPESPPPLAGFSPASSAREREYETRLLALPQPEECGAILRELTKAPHVAGTEGNARVAEFLAAEYRKAGFEVETPTYDVLLSYPRSAKLEIVGEPGVALGRPEEPIASDPDTAVPEAAIAWNAYSPSAEVVGEVVYVNRGSAEDYDRLAKLGIDVRGKIVLARYFGGYRGGKSLEAEKRGALAVLVYSDPIDDGWFQGPVYPEGPWGPASHFQRGADVYDFIVPGDPLTPGWPSRAGMKRIPQAESEILPKIPMMPLSGRDAAEILKRLQGPAVPDSSWQGLAMPETYRIGPGPVRLHLKIENTREQRTIRNIIATLRGTEEPQRKVILSNHYDAWVYGATDPSSGTATMLSLGRALGKLAAEGWKPRRTIILAAWDAEEYTLTGSTEWGEENEYDLARDAVVCINVDEATHGRQFSPSASPLLFNAIRDAARDLPDPGSPGRSLAESWRENTGFVGVQSYATSSGGSEELPVGILGSGSDYTVFFNHLGIASTDLTFDGPYGVYHSVYDTYRWMATEGDPGFLYHAGMAKYAGLLALALCQRGPAAVRRRRLRPRDCPLRPGPGEPARGRCPGASTGTARQEGPKLERRGRVRAGVDRRAGPRRQGNGCRACGRQRVSALPRARRLRAGRPPEPALVPPPHLRPAAVVPRRDSAGNPGSSRRERSGGGEPADRAPRGPARHGHRGGETAQCPAFAPATSDTTA